MDHAPIEAFVQPAKRKGTNRLVKPEQIHVAAVAHPEPDAQKLTRLIVDLVRLDREREQEDEEPKLAA